MKATSNIVRVLFLIVAFVGYTKTISAYQFYYGITNHFCSGPVTIYEGEFADYDYQSWDSCGTDAYNYFDSLCTQWALPEDYFPWFGLTSCDDTNGNPQGTFYCSWTSYSECP